MKVGDLIRYKPLFQPESYARWSGPCLVIRRIPDTGMWIITVRGTHNGVIDSKNYAIEVLNASR